jgi:putative FmdB family regulatory protein
MPTYEYACSSCRHEWEFEQSIKENALTECPQCHEQTARRQISRGTGFILKGSGWYSDLYSSSSNKAPAAEGASSSESKPAADKGSSSTEGSSSSGTEGGSSGSTSSTKSEPTASAA